MNCCETRDEPLSDMRWCNISSTLVALLVALSVAVDVVVACGPGRGAGRRRIGRRLTPLVFKQHEPNMVENSMHASGLAEGTVTRNSTQFQDLVPIYGQDIVFRDEEGTGADRIMTQRCKEKLSTLAISVMNQWPGVKLRVTEGWEEHVTHERNSLHYEGRAVDITTSDRDRAKYGMLARLAVEAGFDWVYYESRAHIHCSVKSESSQAAKYGGCFTADTTVQTSTGARRKLSDLHIGEHILALDPATNTLVYSEVLLFLDWDPNQTHQFIHFVLASGKTLTVTPAHLLMTVDPATNAIVSLYADRLTVDSTLLVTTPGDGAQVTRDRIISVELVLRRGIYAPLTAVGTVVVDGVVASCYATVDSVRLAHWVFAPVRLAMNMRNGVSRVWTLLHKPVASWESREKATGYVAPAAGVYWYARWLYTIGQYLIPYKMHN